MDVLLKASLKRIFRGYYCRVGLDLIELAKCETTIILVNIFFHVHMMGIAEGEKIITFW